MKLTGKLDYLELPATGGTLDRLKAFYSAAFCWSFTDYGPTYSAFAEGLDGGFQADDARDIEDEVLGRQTSDEVRRSALLHLSNMGLAVTPRMPAATPALAR